MNLPFIISVPHAGLDVPPQVADFCILRQEEIRADSDEGARVIYDHLRERAAVFITTPIARAIIDQNRAPTDIGGDGVIKSHTCWNAPVYSSFPDQKLQQLLLELYYFPYHRQLSRAARQSGIILGIDCHTMSAQAPPTAPDPGQTRPLVCLSNGDGTCPREWIESMAIIMRDVFQGEVLINSPFRGGYITRSHATEIPWMQLELSRDPRLTDEEKGLGVAAAFERWAGQWCE